MTPTVFRDGPFRFYFFSREETRMHVHVSGPDGEAKFWLEPSVELVANHGLKEFDLRHVQRVVDERRQEIKDAWRRHFSS